MPETFLFIDKHGDQWIYFKSAALEAKFWRKNGPAYPLTDSDFQIVSEMKVK
jgi:hypothetical protein